MDGDLVVTQIWEYGEQFLEVVAIVVSILAGQEIRRKQGDGYLYCVPMVVCCHLDTNLLHLPSI